MSKIKVKQNTSPFTNPWCGRVNSKQNSLRRFEVVENEEVRSLQWKEDMVLVEKMADKDGLVSFTTMDSSSLYYSSKS